MVLTVLITGFGPFPGAPFNPTEALARTLARMRQPAFADVRRVAHVFATRYDAVDRELPQLLRKHDPDVVLMFGLASRTPFLRVERRARNVRSSIFPDAGGGLPGSCVIAPGMPSALSGRAPMMALVTAVRRARAPARLSENAGRYLCNYVYWRASEWAAGSGALVVFIHVPKVRCAPRRGAGRRRSLTAADLARAGDIALRVLIAAARSRRGPPR